MKQTYPTGTKILLLNQTFYPDVASTAQHAADLALRLTAEGAQVTVISGRRSYDRPDVRLLPEEVWNGVQIYRVFVPGLGKAALWRRALDFASFLASCSLRLATLPKFDVVVALTSPPLIALPAALFARYKRSKMVSWIMDLNPDQAIAAGTLRENSVAGRFLGGLLRFCLFRSDRIVVLDEFMQRRILDKGVPEEKIVVIPPWSHDSAVRYDSAARASFRAQYGLEGKFVVMYSGNHSPCHPLDTLLQAAERLFDEPDIAFCFIGGGTEFAKVKAFAQAHKLANIVCLPYRPIAELSGSLSAADLHVVVMGDAFVGIVHPCKVYNIMSLGIPFLYIGPRPSHITSLVGEDAEDRWAFFSKHGEVDRVVEQILQVRRIAPQRQQAAMAIASKYSGDVLMPRMTQALRFIAEAEPQEELPTTTEAAPHR